MDATLLDEYSQLPPKFAETIRALAGQGILFAAASGRPHVHTGNDVPDLLEEIILIGDNGGAARWKGKDLFVSEMDAADWHTLAGQAQRRGPRRRPLGWKRPMWRSSSGHTTGLQEILYQGGICPPSGGRDRPVRSKFTIYFPEGDAQKGYDALYGPVWGGRFSVAVAGADWVDIMNPGVHKGAALLRLGERLGVPPEGMMAFGDTFNDAEMLKAAKYGFLVENGSPALREEVPFLAPPNTNSGVMQILRRVLAQNGRRCQSDFRRAK